MNDDWLLSVIREIETFARKRNFPRLLPLVEKAYTAARVELTNSPPVDLQTYRLHQKEQLNENGRRT